MMTAYKWTFALLGMVAFAAFAVGHTHQLLMAAVSVVAYLAARHEGRGKREGGAA